MTGRTETSDRRRPVAVLAALVLVGATAACYSYSYGGARYGGPDAPLQARLASTHFDRASLDFAVSDRAHVALFRIENSGHVRALYPYHPGSSSTFASGSHNVLTSTPSFHRGWGPGPTRFSTYRRDTHGCAAGFGHVSASYLMIVASRRPLRMESVRGEIPFRHRPVSVLATPFRRGTAFGTMDRLLARLVPEGLSRSDWDVDWVVATDFGSSWCRGLRPPLFRRIAAQPQPAPDDTTRADERTRRLDGDDVPFNPPGIPVDLPQVASVDGSDGTGRVRVPLPPVELPPVPRVTPEGRDEEEIVIETFDGLEGEGRRPGRAGEPPERRREVGPASAPGPSEHFGRLFGEDDRRTAEGWIPGWSRDHGRTAERRLREWRRELTSWANDPNRNEFPDPPRPPSRWRGGTDWQDGARGFDRPAHRIGGPGDIGDARRIDPPARSPGGRDIEVRRPSSSSDPGGASDARKSGGGSKDRSGR